MTFNRQLFLDELRHLAAMDIPWLHQGDNPDVGFDCVGVVKYAIELQMSLPDELREAFAAYHRPPNGLHMLAVMRRHLIEIDPSERQVADLIVFYVRRNPCHIGTEMGNGLVAEAFEGAGVSRFMIRPRDTTIRIATCFRIPDFA